MNNIQHYDEYYVIGNPIKHSLSPQIHNYFAKQYKQNMIYKSLEINPNKLEYQLKEMKKNNSIKGLSITLPFKEKVYQFCDELDPLSKKAKAVSNVIIKNNRSFYGMNLDGSGLVLDLKNNLNFTIYNKKILIIGAGGAAKGILGAIIQNKPKKIVIANRTFEKAKDLAENEQNVEAQSLSNEIIGSYDLIINATSASVNNQNIPISLNNFKPNSFGYDLMYSNNGTIFTNWCNRHGIKAIDGKGMLMELSKLAFYLWRNQKISSTVDKNCLNELS